MKSLTLTQRTLATVKFRCDIVDAASGRTVKRGVEQTNLFFDYGMDGLAGRSWIAALEYFVLGTGTTPTRRDSGSVKFTRTGTAIVADGSFFEAGDTGRLLKFDSGEECYLTFVDGTHATSNVSGSVAASEGTIYYVNRNSLGSESKRTNTRTTDTGDGGSSYNGATGVLSTWKTQLFSAESGTATYREIGWSHEAGAGANVNGAALIAGGGDVLVSGQQYKVKLQLDRVITPRAARALLASDVVDAWTGDAEEVIESMHFATWDTSGNNSSPANYTALEPGTDITLGLSKNTRAIVPIASINQATDGNGFSTAKNVTFASYVSGSFKREGSAVWEAGEGNATDLAAVFVTNGGWSSHRCRFDDPQTKTSSQKLTLRFRKSWGRVLVN